MTMYSYGVRNRPIGFATVPKGYVEARSHPAFRHGVVVYESALPYSEIESYELQIIPSAAQLDELSSQIATELGLDYKDEYIEMYQEDQRAFEAGVGQKIERALVFADRATVAKMVYDKLVGR